MWTILFLVLAFRTAVHSSPPCPTNVTFFSVNLRNVLQWSPGHDTEAHTKYTVQYAIYGDRKENRAHWRKVRHCFEITRHWCDLSVETWDLEQEYYAKVRAVSRKNNSKWVETDKRFHPSIHTEFGPSHVSVEIENNNAIVTIEGPMRYLPHNHTPGVSMAKLYPLTYNLSVHNTHTGQTRHFLLTTNVYTYRMMDYATEYCFSATTMIVYRSAKHHPSTRHCITTPQDPLIDQLKRIVVGIVVPAVLLCLLASLGYVIYNYLSGKDQKSPDSILKQPRFFPPPLALPPENLNIIVISASKDFGKGKLYPDLNNTLLPISSPIIQRPETPPPPREEPCDNSTVDYGFAAAVKENTEVVNVGKCNIEKQSYKSKEWEIEAESSGGTYASQNSFLQSPWSSINPMLLNQVDENNRGLVLHNNPETGSLHLQYNIESSADENDMIFTGASQSVAPSSKLDELPDDYGTLGVAAEEEEEDEGPININWDPSTRKLVIPGFDLGLVGKGNGVKLETVFVRQPSEEEALLGTEERIGDAEWGTEDLEAKWNLVVSSDVSL